MRLLWIIDGVKLDISAELTAEPSGTVRRTLVRRLSGPLGATVSVPRHRAIARGLARIRNRQGPRRSFATTNIRNC